MNAKRMYFVLIGLLVLSLFGLVGGAYVLDGLLGKQATKLADLKQETTTLNSQRVGLKKAKQDIATYSSLDQITSQIVPQDKDQAQTVREIVNIAARAGVTLTNIDFPASTLGSTTAPAPATGSTGTSTPQAAISAKPTTSQLVAVPNLPGVYQLQIVVQNNVDTEVTYPQFYNFLSGLEVNRRTALVSAITITPDPNDRSALIFSLTLNEYIKPS